MTPALHPLEDQRIARLRLANILDTPRDRRFDRVIFLVSQILKMPIGLVAFVDTTRVWSKARVGVTSQEVPRDDSFAAYVILQDTPLAVEDARADPRFAAKPQVVGAPYIRSYVGVALRSREGLPLGCLCAMDRVPRQVPREHIAMLTTMGREVEELIAEPAPPAAPMISASV